MNYVRKLGFEETPDYDFLRELFTKVLKTLGEPEDGVFDWMLLNGGKGWESINVSIISLIYSNSSLIIELHIDSIRLHPQLLHRIGKRAATESTAVVVHDRLQMGPHLINLFSALLLLIIRAADEHRMAIVRTRGTLTVPVCNLLLLKAGAPARRQGVSIAQHLVHRIRTPLLLALLDTGLGLRTTLMDAIRPILHPKCLPMVMAT